MSLSDHFQDYRELFECDESSIGNDIGTSTTASLSSNSSLPLPTARSHAQTMADRSPRHLPDRRFSEMSMDLSDLQDLLDVEEEGTSGRVVSGSKCNITSKSALSDGSLSSWYHGSGVNSTLEIDEIPEDYFHDRDSVDPSPCRSLSEQNRLSIVSEQGESESESSMSTSSLIKRPSLQPRNKDKNVKFEISTRLENIYEFDKPDVEDYHRLYYTAHELQKMIDGRRAVDEEDLSDDG